LALPVDESWLPNGSTKSAILFTDKPSCPPIWAAISCELANETARIGFTKDKQLRTKFGITAVPSILMIDGEDKMVYEGKTAFPDVLKAVRTYLGGGPKPTPKIVIQRKPQSNVLVHNLTVVTEFNHACKGQGTFCVVQGGEKASGEFEKIAEQYRKERTKFYICGSDCPVEYARAGIWILHHKREAAIRLESCDELQADLDRALDGRGVFVPMSKLLEIPIKDL
jgi:hypothetical protein